MTSTLYYKDHTEVTFGSDGSVVTRSGPQIKRHSFPTFVTALGSDGNARSFYVDSAEDFAEFLKGRGYSEVTL